VVRADQDTEFTVSTIELSPIPPELRERLDEERLRNSGAGSTVLSLSEVREWQKKPPQAHHFPTTDPTDNGRTLTHAIEDHFSNDRCRQEWVNDSNSDGN
jgi:hypothetical protein